MTAGSLNFTIEQGATFSRVLTWRLPALTISAVANTTNPLITTTTSHGLAVNQQVDIAGVVGAVGANASQLVVASTPSTTTFTVTLTPAPGAYVSGGTVTPRVNLTGYTAAEMDIRATPSSAEIITLTMANSRIALGGAAGTITLTISATDTDALTGWSSAVYDLELTSAAGFVTRLISGTVTLSPSVSH